MIERVSRVFRFPREARTKQGDDFTAETLGKAQSPSFARIDRLKPAPPSRIDRLKPAPPRRIDRLKPAPPSRIDRLKPAPPSRIDRLKPVPPSRIDRLKPVPQGKLVKQRPGESHEHLINSGYAEGVERYRLI